MAGPFLRFHDQLKRGASVAGAGRRNAFWRIMSALFDFDSIAKSATAGGTISFLIELGRDLKLPGRSRR
jgi:hypothetical protein